MKEKIKNRSIEENYDKTDKDIIKSTQRKREREKKKKIDNHTEKDE